MTFVLIDRTTLLPGEIIIFTWCSNIVTLSNKTFTWWANVHYRWTQNLHLYVKLTNYLKCQQVTQYKTCYSLNYLKHFFSCQIKTFLKLILLYEFDSRLFFVNSALYFQKTLLLD